MRFSDNDADPRTDIGVIALPTHEDHGRVPMAISLKSATKGQLQFVFGGWGRTSNSGSSGTLNAPPVDGQFNADHFGSLPRRQRQRCEGL